MGRARRPLRAPHPRPHAARPLGFHLALLSALVISSGCGREAAGPNLSGTRGYIIISLGAVGADHVGPETTPFLLELAERGVSFERAFAQYPSTLTSLSSLFTGLYPPQHGAYPPSWSMSPELDTLPTRFASFGYQTAGHTEGGFASGRFGFHRGFDDFSETELAGDGGDNAFGTFKRGLDWLEHLEEGDPFFLFLHTYSAHPPYAQAAETRRQESDFEPTFRNLRSVNGGFLQVDAATVESLAVSYDAALRRVDRALEELFDEFQRLGILGEATVIVTADHGQEFLQHGRVGHSQVYPETLHVPLVILHPELPEKGRRSSDLVELIDVAPTLYELAGLPRPEAMSGQSLVPLLTGPDRGEGWAYAEARDGRGQSTLLRQSGGTTHQYVETRHVAEADGTWVTRTAAADFSEPPLELSLAAFPGPRDVKISLEGEELLSLTVGAAWTSAELPLPPSRERYRLDLFTDGCSSPKILGLSDDPRCLSFKVRGLELRLGELFDLDRDPVATTDTGTRLTAVHSEMRAELSSLAWPTVARPRYRAPADPNRDVLRALGYLP